MLQLNSFLEYKSIIDIPINESNDVDVESISQSESVLQDGKIFIDCKYVTLAIPVDKIKILTEGGKVILDSKELKPIVDKYEKNDTEGIAEELIKLIIKNKDKIKDSKLLKQINDQSEDEVPKLSFKINVRDLEVHPPKGNKLQKAGIDIYLVISELEILATMINCKLTKLTLGDIVIKNIGKINTVKLLKYALIRERFILGALSVFANSFITTSDDGTIDFNKNYKGKLKKGLKQLVKKHIDEIKGLDKTVKLDKNVEEIIKDRIDLEKLK